ncbi:hypothetical protein ACFL0Q_08350 [Thermodesulfobacteriota bacterium]
MAARAGDRWRRRENCAAMSQYIKGDPWVWVGVQTTGGKDQYVGMHDSDRDVSFIPVFLSKEEALECFVNIPRNPGQKYEIQATLYSELAKDATDNGFALFVTDSDGKVVEELEP